MKRVLAILVSVVMAFAILPAVHLHETKADIPYGNTFSLVTNASQLTVGGTYLIVGIETDGVYYAMSAANSNGNNMSRVAIPDPVSGKILGVTSGAYIFTLGTGEVHPEAFSFKHATDGFLYAKGTGTANQLGFSTAATVPLSGEFAITVAATGVATVVASWHGTNRNTIMNNNASDMFACYQTGSQADIYLYKMDEIGGRTFTLNTDGLENITVTNVTPSALGYEAGTTVTVTLEADEGYELPDTTGDFLTVTNATSYTYTGNAEAGSLELLFGAHNIVVTGAAVEAAEEPGSYQLVLPTIYSGCATILYGSSEIPVVKYDVELQGLRADEYIGYFGANINVDNTQLGVHAYGANGLETQVSDSEWLTDPIDAINYYTPDSTFRAHYATARVARLKAAPALFTVYFTVDSSVAEGTVIPVTFVRDHTLELGLRKDDGSVDAQGLIIGADIADLNWEAIDGEIIVGHNWGEWEDGATATCMTPGTRTRTCQDCGAIDTEEGVVDPTNHAGTVALDEDTVLTATCVAAGYTGDTVCDACLAVVTAGTATEIDPDNHVGTVALDESTIVIATCVTAGYTGDTVCDACSAVVTAGTATEIDPDNHAGGVHTDEDSAIEPTCEDPGKEADTVCSACEAVLVEGAVIEALGHDIILKGLCEASEHLVYGCSRCEDMDEEVALAYSLGVKARTPGYDAIQFGANIDVAALAEVLEAGDTLTYGYYAFPKAKLEDAGSPALGTNHEKTKYMGSATGTAIAAIAWDESYATPSVLAAALMNAGYKVYDYNDAAGTLSISLIVTGMGGEAMQAADIVFRPFVSISIAADYDVYGSHIYNSINRIRDYVENGVGDGKSMPYIPLVY